MIESCLLGVTNWWLDKYNRAEVMSLVSRHFRPEEALEANKQLSSMCQLGDPIQHRNSALRSAGDAIVVDLVNNLEVLNKEKRAPRYLVPSDKLDKVHVSALSVGNEVAVGARLESLEGTMAKVSAMLEKLMPASISSTAMTSRINSLEENVMRLSSLLESGHTPQAPSFRTMASSGCLPTPTVLVSGPAANVGDLNLADQLGVDTLGAGGTKATYATVTSQSGARIRSRSSSQKRKADEQLEKEDRNKRPVGAVGQTHLDGCRSQVYPGNAGGQTHPGGSRGQARPGGEGGGQAASNEGGEGPFNRQGRPRVRKLASGTSQVQVDGVADYVAPVEYYIGNTGGKTTEEDIRTVLTKCAAPILGGDNLRIEKIELLTKELNPRTKCWKVVIPYRFKDIMEKDEVYPTGWRHRKFFGSRNTKQRRTSADNQNQNGLGDQILRDRQLELENLVQKQEEERQALEILSQKQKEEESRLAHEAERLKLLEDRMKGSKAGVLLKQGGESSM